MMNLFDEGQRDQVPGHNAVVHQLQESSESEGQHLTKAEGRKEKSVQVTNKYYLSCSGNNNSKKLNHDDFNFNSKHITLRERLL